MTSTYSLQPTAYSLQLTACNMNILIVKLSAIGDVIHTLPALNAIRRHDPDAHITWLVEEAAYPLIEGHQAVDRVLVSRRKHWIKTLFTSGTPLAERMTSLKEASLFVKALRETRYDLVIDFQQLLKSGVLVWLSRGNRKAGYNKGMEHMEQSHLFLNDRIPPVKMNHHALLRNLMLLNALGIPSDEIVFHLPVRDQDRREVDSLLARHEVNISRRPLVALNPVAKWETKLWSNAKFSALGDRLFDDGAELVFTGGPEDQDTVQEILRGMKGRAANLVGQTSLKMLAALYEKIDLLVTTDTGPMHLAAAIGTRVVAIFGPTAPWRTGPFGSGHQVIRAGLECSPCFKRQCDTKACMERISVADVLDSCKL